MCAPPRNDAGTQRQRRTSAQRHAAAAAAEQRGRCCAQYEGDVRSLHAFGFDGVKIDGCGRQRNQTLYAELMRASGKNYTIENCHWGDCTDSDDSSCPTLDWCAPSNSRG